MITAYVIVWVIFLILLGIRSGFVHGKRIEAINLIALFYTRVTPNKPEMFETATIVTFYEKYHDPSYPAFLRDVFHLGKWKLEEFYPELIRDMDKKCEGDNK